MKDSLIYLEILKYVRENGIEQFRAFIKSIVNISLFKKKELKVETINEFFALLETTDINVMEFINSLNLDIRQKAFFLDSRFSGFIYQVGETIDKIDLYIENAQKLVDLGIEKIDIINLSSNVDYKITGHITYENINNISAYVNSESEFVYYKDGNISCCNYFYTDGKFKIKRVSDVTGSGTLESPYVPERIDGVEFYEIIVKGATFLIEVENTQHDKDKKRIAITDFGFDASKLPESLESQFEPEYARQYKKTLKPKDK